MYRRYVLKDTLRNIAAVAIACLAFITVYIDRMLPRHVADKYTWLSHTILAISIIGAIVALIYIYNKEKNEKRKSKGTPP